MKPKRYARMAVRVSEADRLHLKTQAKAAGLSVSDHVRTLLGLSRDEKPTPKDGPCQ